MNDELRELVVVVEPGANVVVTPQLCGVILRAVGRLKGVHLTCTVCGRMGEHRGAIYASDETFRRVRQIHSLQRQPWMIIGLCCEHNSYRHAGAILRGWLDSLAEHYLRLLN